jgi:hypothetical protein
LLTLWGTVAGAQPVLECPPGPFDCVPWNPRGGGGNPAPPPPPFFEVEPRFIQPERFNGFIGNGRGTHLEIHEGTPPDGLRELVESYGISMDPDRLYVLPSGSSSVDIEGDYIIFNGVRIE